MNKRVLCLLILCGFQYLSAQSIAVLKYNGGGDWYSNPTALKNLIQFCNSNIQSVINAKPETVDVGSEAIFEYPYLHMTGHGNVEFSESESKNLRTYLLGGGFLHIDDNYGMDPYVRPAMKKVFPELEFVELPFNHQVYHQVYDFPSGLPKIHKHDDKPAQGLGLIYKGRVVCFYSYESDLGDGWEDQSVHKDPQSIRLKALQMGANILKYAFES